MELSDSDLPFLDIVSQNNNFSLESLEPATGGVL